MGTFLVVLSLISLGSVAAPRAAAPRAHVSHAALAERVWSNDDINYLRQHAPVSVIGAVAAFSGLASAPSASSQHAALQAPYVKEDDPEWYAREIDLRRAAIAGIEARLAHIASVEEGGQGISNAFPLTGTNPGILLPGTVYVLEQQDFAWRSEIADLQDLAQSREIPRAAWR